MGGNIYIVIFYLFSFIGAAHQDHQSTPLHSPARRFAGLYMDIGAFPIRSLVEERRKLQLEKDLLLQRLAETVRAEDERQRFVKKLIASSERIAAILTHAV